MHLITHTLVSAICRLSFALRQPVSGLHARRSNSVHSFWRGGGGGGGGCGSWRPRFVHVEIDSALGGNNRWTGSSGCANRTQTLGGKYLRAVTQTVKDGLCKRSGGLWLHGSEKNGEVDDYTVQLPSDLSAEGHLDYALTLLSLCRRDRFTCCGSICLPPNGRCRSFAGSMVKLLYHTRGRSQLHIWNDTHTHASSCPPDQWLAFLNLMHTHKCTSERT